MKPYRLFLLALLAVLVPISAARAGTLDFPEYGFQIEALDAPSTHLPMKALMMYLPPHHELNPNVNVLIQPFQSLKDYVALTKKQFLQTGWKLISDKVIGENEWKLEYSGAFQGINMHWYARAIFTPAKIYLVTATTPEEDWNSLAEKLRHCVDSFKTSQTSQPAM